MTGFFIAKCNINLCLKARESDKKKKRKREKLFSRSCQHKAAVWRRPLSPNAMYYRVLGKCFTTVRVDEKDLDWFFL